MPWSRKKYKQRQREYTRRRTQPSRIQAEEKKRNNIVRPILEQKAKENRTANLFQNILGIVAAQGHGKNVVPLGRAISKRTASNYLIQSMYPRQPTGRLERTPIFYAIEKGDVEKARELVKGMKGVLNKKNVRDTTPLEFTLQKLYLSTEKGANWETNKRTSDLLQILELLLQEGASMDNARVLSLFWRLHPSVIIYFVNTYPSIGSITRERANTILADYNRMIEITEMDIEEERGEFHRPSYGNEGGYGYVPQHLYNTLNEYDAARDNLIEFLEAN